MKKRARRNEYDIPLEDSLNDDWSKDLSMVEVPIGNKPLFALGIIILVIGLSVFGRIVFLDTNGAYYTARAADNVDQSNATPAPRGIIYDKEGDPLVENQAAFAAVLNAHQFISNVSLQSSTLTAIQNVLGVSSDTVWSMLQDSEHHDFATPIVLAEDLSQAELVNLQARNLPTIAIQSDFKRVYPDGQVFSSIVGFVGRPTAVQLQNNPSLTADDFVGKDGIEEYYDAELQGKSGVQVNFRDARGNLLGQTNQSAPQIGDAIHLTIDGGLQKDLYSAIQNELAILGRQIGVGLAMDPRNGQVLALVNVPGYDNNLFSDPASNTLAIKNLLTSSEEPMFNRIVSGQYNPGSTIKPLDAVAALKDGVVTPNRTVFSPGYLMVPNPYNPSAPTRYADWQYQGTVNLASALAQSSDVYFYVVVGGSPAYTTPPLNDPSDYGIQGLGMTKLHDWWQTFGLGAATHIDLPGEETGFLPTPQWKQQTTGTPWLLGDTYNVAIGQGNLLLTPIQLLSYIDAIANGGTIWRPYLNASSTPEVNENLTDLLPQIQAVQQGMLEGVTSPRGTSHTLSDLPLQVCAKTGSAQINNNTEENALFVGYAPCNNPQIALLILIENSKQGSLNAVPIAKQVFNWYYQNRLSGNATSSIGNSSTTTP